MRISTSLVLGAFASLVASAPLAQNTSSSIDGTLIPQEAIISGLTIPDDVYPVFNYENNTATVVFLNATLLAEAKASNTNSKRDLSSYESETSKRDMNPSRWRWVCMTARPWFGKREAEAEAEAEPWHWVALKIGQPFFKRDAEAEADPWHWVALKIGQPFFKRDAEASADPWHWVALKIGQPFF